MIPLRHEEARRLRQEEYAKALSAQEDRSWRPTYEQLKQGAAEKGIFFGREAPAEHWRGVANKLRAMVSEDEWNKIPNAK